MPHVKVNDIEMNYEIHGEGQPLVMIHGFTGSNHMWRPLISELGEHFKLILPDMRGHGGSTNPSGTFTHRQSALDIYALLDHLKIDKFKAIGHSSGGNTLIHMATMKPERVTDMVLASATPYFIKETRELMAETSFDSIPSDRMELYRRIHIYGDEQIRMLADQFHGFKDSYDDMNFTPPYLSTIMARTLIVHGDRDEFFPVQIPLTLYGSIPRSYLWIVPNAGHGLFSPEPVYGFSRLCLDFLTGGWGG